MSAKVFQKNQIGFHGYDVNHFFSMAAAFTSFWNHLSNMEKVEIRTNLTRALGVLQISIGIVYLWFGFLKFFPNLSPAEALAGDTIHRLTFGLLGKQTSVVLLATWEVGAGLLLTMRKYFAVAFWIVMVHMAFTFTPLVLLPDVSFTSAPYGLTLVGQYIIKNIIIVSALLVIREFFKKN